MQNEKFEQEIKPHFLKFKRGQYDNLLAVWRDSGKLRVDVDYQDIIVKYGPDNKEARRALSELCKEVKEFLISKYGEQNVWWYNNFSYYLDKSINREDVIKALTENFTDK